MQVQRIAYGSDESQFGDLYRASGDARSGVVVIVHGGFWRAQYGLSLGAPLATDLAACGYTCWNIEYRRVGNGGGWPQTFDDVGAAIDKLASVGGVDTSRVVVIGHSAGGQLAAWTAHRAKLPANVSGSQPKVGVTGVVSQAGVLDMLTAVRTQVGGTAVSELLGGSPQDIPTRYREADPVEQVPVEAPVLCVHGHADDIVPLAQSTAYVAAATKAGGQAALHVVGGDHFTLIDPKSGAWQVVRDALPSLFAGHLPT